MNLLINRSGDLPRSKGPLARDVQISRNWFRPLLLISLMFVGPVGYAATLHDAVKSGNLKQVKRLIAGGSNPNENDAVHKKLVRIAAGKGNLEMVKLLLEIHDTPHNHNDSPHGHVDGHDHIAAIYRAKKDRRLDISNYIFNNHYTVFQERLTDWKLSRTAAKKLTKYQWWPRSINDEIHLLVALRKKSELLQNRRATEFVLFEDIRSNDYKTIENALYAFIGLGQKEVIPKLVQTLDSHGTKKMAEAYLNCGLKELDIAAREWARKKGYTISSGRGANPIDWGKL